MARLIAKHIIKTKLYLHSGLHIGDSKEKVEIGGIDSPVIRRKDNNQPYIPGSSLKGKIRCLLEQSQGITDVGKDEKINKVFGCISNSGATMPSRLIFRDAYLSVDSAKKLWDSSYTDMHFTEAKSETSIDRVNGNAKKGSLRTQERIPAGVEFDIEIVVNEWEDDPGARDAIAMLTKGIKLVNLDFLGGGGSRGSGHVEIYLQAEKGYSLVSKKIENL
jgi:CRISPR-associated protein Csm3